LSALVVFRLDRRPGHREKRLFSAIQWLQRARPLISKKNMVNIFAVFGI
jgi:hypothetical protein